MKKIIGVLGNRQLIFPQQGEMAHQVGKLLIENNYRLVCGGRSGVMEEVCRGAREAKNYQPGDIIGILPGNHVNEANPYVDIPIATTIGLTRNVLIANSQAVIAIGGGAGTLSEIAFAWQFQRLVFAWRGGGWSAKLADQKIDDNRSFLELDDDRVFRFDCAEKMLEDLNKKVPLYEKLSNQKE